MKKFRPVFLFIFLIAAVPLFSQEKESGYAIEQTGKNSGQFPREYKVRYSVGPRWKILDIATTNVDFGKVSVLLSVESVSGSSALVRVQSFELSNFTIPPLPVRVFGGGKTNIVMTPEVLMEQTALKVNISNVAPIEEIFSISDPAIFILILLSALLAGTAGLLIYRVFFMKKKSVIRMDDRIDPYEEALKNLNRLKQTAWNDKNIKELYLGIWQVVRRFLDRVFGFTALEMSTSEIAAQFRKTSGEAGGLDELHDVALHILKICDRVKYAKYRPETGQAEVVLKDSYELVRKTREHFDFLKTAEERQTNGTGEEK